VLEIVRINSDDIWQKYSRDSRKEFACVAKQAHRIWKEPSADYYFYHKVCQCTLLAATIQAALCPLPTILDVSIDSVSVILTHSKTTSDKNTILRWSCMCMYVHTTCQAEYSAQSQIILINLQLLHKHKSIVICKNTFWRIDRYTLVRFYERRQIGTSGKKIGIYSVQPP